MESSASSPIPFATFVIFLAVLLSTPPLSTSSSGGGGLGRTELRVWVPDKARITPQEEEYVCTVEKLNLTQDLFLEQFAYQIHSQEAHHFLLYGCKNVPTFARKRKYWPCNGKGMYNLCSKRKHIPIGIPLQPDNNNDNTTTTADTGFSKRSKFPEGVAYGVGPNFDVNYLLLEVHFMPRRFHDVPVPTEGQLIDNSLAISQNFSEGGGDRGLLVLAKGSTRRPQYLSGMLVMAGVGFRIPPHEDKFHVNINCKPELSVPIYPFAYWVHTHGLGRVVSGYVVNPRTKTFTEFAKWSHHRPQPVVLVSNALVSEKSFTKVLPGEYLAGRCTYNSSSASKEVLWGPKHSSNEMCNLFVFYFTESNRIADLSLSCVNERSSSLSQHFPKDSDVLY